jgi:hypothetical protein
MHFAKLPSKVAPPCAPAQRENAAFLALYLNAAFSGRLRPFLYEVPDLTSAGAICYDERTNAQGAKERGGNEEKPFGAHTGADHRMHAAAAFVVRAHQPPPEL